MPVTAMTADQVAAKWSQRLQASTQQITDGVNAVTVAPGATAAQRADLWLARVTASKAKWQAKVGAVTLDQWKAAMLNVGVGRVAQGAQVAQPKVAAFMTKFLPYLKTGVAQVQAMPKVTLQDSINRAVAMIQYNAAYPG
jgi:hypothetical protein